MLTVDVFSALNFLPRTWFLGEVLNAARGADLARAALIRDVEDAIVDVLPGDLRPLLPSGSAATWTVQPDVTIATADGFCLVEAKRLKPSSFQPQQLARITTTIAHLSQSRSAFCLLVLATDPPVKVQGHGRLAISEAIGLADDSAGSPDPGQAGDHMAVITWDEIAAITRLRSGTFTNADPSARATVSRLEHEVTNSVSRHR